ncbi:hypothetical protein CBS9595_001139 [Malassezia furfur]|nr:hypothetical protein CBS9595_001139 [Malassezia furfur]
MLPPPARKRAASNDARILQRPRAEDVRLPVVLEYHRNIARATAVVWDAAEPVRCNVSQGTLTLRAGEACNVLSLDWPLVDGVYMGEVQDGAQVVTLPAQTSPPLALVPQSPWLQFASEQTPVLALACAACGSTLMQCSGAATLRALPSENWEELVDAWMCHGDQRLNASVVQGRADVEPSRTPELDQIWVGSLMVRMNSAQLMNVHVADAKIPGPWEGDAFPASCAQCSAVLGAVPVHDAPSAAQLLQTSVVPVPRTLSYATYFSEILANYLVEQADRHAVHHFLIQALGAEPQPRLFVWVFQPIVELCTTQRMAVCKILYHTSTTPPQVPYHSLTLPATQATHCTPRHAKNSRNGT